MTYCEQECTRYSQRLKRAGYGEVGAQTLLPSHPGVGVGATGAVNGGAATAINMGIL